MRSPTAKKKILEELRKIPVVQVACEKVGISRQTFYRWRTEDPKFDESVRAALEEGDQFVHDMVETKYYGRINKDDWRAIKYYLDHRHPKYKGTETPSLARPHPFANPKVSREAEEEIEKLKEALAFEKKLREPLDLTTISSDLLKDIKEFEVGNLDKAIEEAERREAAQRQN